MRKPVFLGQHRWLWLGAAGLAALYSLGIFWGLPSILTPASDSIAPLGPLAFAADLRDPTKSFIYPAVHQILLLAVYAVVLIGAKITGAAGAISGTWPYGFRNPTLMFSALIAVSNLVSILMGLAVLGCMLRTRIFEPAQQWFGAALLGLSGVFIYYARVGNMDVPYLFWWMLSYTALWTFLFRRPALRWLLLSGIAGALAIGTKDQAAGLLLGSGLLLLLMAPAVKDSPAGGWGARIKNAAIFSAALVGTYAIVAVMTNPARWVRHVRFVANLPIPGMEPAYPAAEFPVTPWGELQLAWRVIERTSHIITPVGVLLGFAGLAAVLASGRRREFWFVVLPPATYYAMVIATIRATEERYLLPLAIALCFGANALAGRFLRSARSSAAHTACMTLCIALLAYQGIFSAYPVTFVQLFNLKRSLAAELPALVPPGRPLLIVNMYSFGLPNANVYDRYPLMHPPGETLLPPSTHGEHLFSPFKPGYRFILSGFHRPWSDEYLKDAVLVRSWTYPEWIKRRVYVPAIHEFSLYERR
ncbi:MAG TPA: hypothetical protein VFW83_08035 [Bryobacteraceae bacterium]|nr:hypothetical protein [Bryobacteraceae bacterium]